VPAVAQPRYETPGSIEALAGLRARIAKIEGHTPGLNSDSKTETWTSGFAQLDTALGGLGLSALNEIVAASPVDLPVASAFALGLLARLKRRGPLLWCLNGLTQNEYGALYAPGLAAFGIDPSRIVSVTVRQPRDLSFVLEEAARASSLAAIIAEGPLPSFTASRRLALLLAASGVPMLFLPDGKMAEGSAAATRLVVSSIAAPDQSLIAQVFDPRSLDPRSPGPPAFRVTLARIRGGRPGLEFEMVFDHATLSFKPLFSAPLSGAQFDSIPDRQFSVASAPKLHRWA
jgi:protein ImuA